MAHRHQSADHDLQTDDIKEAFSDYDPSFEHFDPLCCTRATE
jgi:hypothetical protein